jgi:hypothetical protein
MKCHTLRDAIVELARGGGAGAGTMAAVESHLEHCASCAALMTRERQLSQGLRALAEATAGDAPSDALGRRLIETFAGRLSVPPRARKVVTIGWMPAAAAAALMAATGALWWGVGREPTTESLRAPQAATAAVQQPDPVPAAGVALKSVTDNRRTNPEVGHRPRAARRRSVPTAPVVRATGFVSLPGADGLPDFESGEIVRIEIPFASLPTYGLEILPEARGTPVKADLLVGQDGQARAIRLVQASTLR